MLQDGNYTEFAVGQRRQFALEFHYHRNRRLVQVEGPRSRTCRYTGQVTDYDVTAHLLLDAGPVHEGFFLLDFGLRAYKQQMVLDDLEPPPAGSWLSGVIGLSVDPFDYMDDRFRPVGLPPLIYTWTVDGIEKATTPPMTVEYGHPLYIGPNDGPKQVPDPARESWQTVETTRMWDDAFYRLHCTLDPVEPTNTMAASGPRSPYGPLAPRT